MTNIVVSMYTKTIIPSFVFSLVCSNLVSSVPITSDFPIVGNIRR